MSSYWEALWFVVQEIAWNIGFVIGALILVLAGNIIIEFLERVDHEHGE